MPSTIVDVSEAKKLVGRAKKCSPADLGLIQILLPIAEAQVQDYLGYLIAQGTYTEYYPTDEMHDAKSSENDLIVDYDTGHGSVLQLRKLPVRSITNCWQDIWGLFGQGPGQAGTGSAFDASTLLIQGTDFYLELTTDGLSETGLLIRRYWQWPVTPGSVKVQYVAGYTEAELGGRYSTFRWAVLQQFGELWSIAKTLKGGGRAAAVQNEQIGDRVSTTYFHNRLYGTPVIDDVADTLEPYVNYEQFSF